MLIRPLTLASCCTYLLPPRPHELNHSSQKPCPGSPVHKEEDFVHQLLHRERRGVLLPRRPGAVPRLQLLRPARCALVVAQQAQRVQPALHICRLQLAQRRG